MLGLCREHFAESTLPRRTVELTRTYLQRVCAIDAAGALTLAVATALTPTLATALAALSLLILKLS